MQSVYSGRDISSHMRKLSVRGKKGSIQYVLSLLCCGALSDWKTDEPPAKLSSLICFRFFFVCCCITYNSFAFGNSTHAQSVAGKDIIDETRVRTEVESATVTVRPAG